MDINVKKYLDRAESELILANANFSLSISNEIKNIFKIQEKVVKELNKIKEEKKQLNYLLLSKNLCNKSTTIIFIK